MAHKRKLDDDNVYTRTLATTVEAPVAHGSCLEQLVLMLRDNNILLSYLLCEKVTYHYTTTSRSNYLTSPQEKHEALRNLAVCSSKLLVRCKQFAKDSGSAVVGNGSLCSCLENVEVTWKRDLFLEGSINQKCFVTSFSIWPHYDLVGNPDACASLNECLRALPRLRVLDVGMCNADLFVPPLVKVLSLSPSFNKPLCELPRGLIELKMHGDSFSHTLAGLPETLLRFSYSNFSTDAAGIDLSQLPAKLRVFKYNGNRGVALDRLPLSVTRISYNANVKLPPGVLPLPQSCTRLSLCVDGFKDAMLPSRLERVTISTLHAADWGSLLHSTVRQVSLFAYTFTNHTVFSPLPTAITALRISLDYLHELVLPPNLETLHLMRSGNWSHKGNIQWPASLTKLFLSDDDIFYLSSLPANLQVLFSGRSLHTDCTLPNSVRSLYVSSDWEWHNIPTSLNLLAISIDAILPAELNSNVVVHVLPHSSSPRKFVQALGYSDFTDL